MCIYIYTEREREIDRDVDVLHRCMNVCRYIWLNG